MLDAVRHSLEGCDFSKDSINIALKELAEKLNVPYSKIMMLCRTAVTGVKVYRLFNSLRCMPTMFLC